MDKEGTKQKPNDGLIARILGGTPTILQKVFFIFVIVFVMVMGLSSCLCQPRYVSFLHLVEKIDSINTHFYTLQQAPPDSGVLLKETLVKELLGDIFYHRKEVRNREVRLVGVSKPYTQVLACAFNIKSIGFEWKTNETFLVTYGHDGKIADAKTQLAILKTWALLQIQGKK